MPAPDIMTLANQIRAGSRRDLAKGITIAESARECDRSACNRLLDELLPNTGNAIRIAISGLPGVGKSTFIESLGVFLCGKGLRVAVLSVDPSSSFTGGSILGDKTRMPRLAADDNAFIRPTPSGGASGGVSNRTRESILLCEAAGYNVVLVETVGVGQVEIAVASMVDLFLLLLLPATGDALQGIKRGILECADIILVNKADGDMQTVAARTVADYRAALQLLRKTTGQEDNACTDVFAVSSTQNFGIENMWNELETRWFHSKTSGKLEQKRKEQRLSWTKEDLYDTVFRRLIASLDTGQTFHSVQKAVANGDVSPGTAVAQLVQTLERNKDENR